MFCFLQGFCRYRSVAKALSAKLMDNVQTIHQYETGGIDTLLPEKLVRGYKVRKFI